jgi:hypothetical protein
MRFQLKEGLIQRPGTDSCKLLNTSTFPVTFLPPTSEGQKVEGETTQVTITRNSQKHGNVEKTILFLIFLFHKFYKKKKNKT